MCIDGQRGRCEFLAFLSLFGSRSFGKVAYIHIRRTLSIGASVFGYIDDFDDKLTRTMGYIIYSHGIFDRFVGTAHRIVRLHVHS